MKKIVISVFAIIICIFFVVSIYAGNQGKTPGTVKLDILANKYKPVIFDHPKHASIAGDCGMCHHQHGSSGTLPCKDCHTVSPSTFKNSVTNYFMACKNCHSTFDPANPKMPGLKVAYHSTCFKCHRGMGNVGIDPKGCTMMCHAKKEQKVSLKTN